MVNPWWPFQTAEQICVFVFKDKKRSIRGGRFKRLTKYVLLCVVFVLVFSKNKTVNPWLPFQTAEQICVVVFVFDFCLTKRNGPSVAAVSNG